MDYKKVNIKKQEEENLNFLINNEENEKYSKVSRCLTSRFSDFKQKRTLKQNEWIRNSMQYDGIYERAILDAIKPGKCKLYDPTTQTKVEQFTASAVDLVLPSGDKNFTLYNTPNVNLPKKLLDEIVNKMKADALQQDPPIQITQEDIDTTIQEVSNARAKKMEKTVFDQLLESNYMEIISKALKSSAKYGVGVVKGPFNKNKTVTSVEMDEFGNFDTVSSTVQVPCIEYVSPWDFFPDLDSKTINDMRGVFFYHTLTKGDLSELADRSDFIGKNINSFIKNKPSGNFQYESYENLLTSTGNEMNRDTNPDKFRAVEYWGSLSGCDLKGIFPDLVEWKDYEVCVWMLDSLIIKCVLNPYKSGKRPYHIFNYKISDSQIIGTGLCSLLESYQRALNSAVRATHDLMAWMANPAFTINDELLVPGSRVSRIGPGDVIHRTGTDQTAQFPIIQPIELANSLPQLLELQKLYREKMDDISNLNQILQGDLSGQASSGRTSSGINALMGQANITLREFARDFDYFNISIIQMMIEWNIMFNKDQTIKADYQVYPRVSTAIVQKQLQSNALNQLVVTLQPEERPWINWKNITQARFLSNNLDPDMMILSDKEYQQNISQQQQMQEQQTQLAMQTQQLQNAKLQAETENINVKSQVEQVNAQNGTDKVEIDRLKALSSAETNRNNGELQEGKLKLDAMSEDHSFTRDMLSHIAEQINSQNPALNRNTGSSQQ